MATFIVVFVDMEAKIRKPIEFTGLSGNASMVSYMMEKLLTTSMIIRMIIVYAIFRL